MSKKKTTIWQRLTNPAAPADKYVLWIALVLAAAGVVAVYSAISFLAETKAGGDTERFLLRHVVRLGLALGAVAVFSVIDYRMLARSLVVSERSRRTLLWTNPNPSFCVVSSYFPASSPPTS